MRMPKAYPIGSNGLTITRTDAQAIETISASVVPISTPTAAGLLRARRIIDHRPVQARADPAAHRVPCDADHARRAHMLESLRLRCVRAQLQHQPDGIATRPELRRRSLAYDC